MTRVYLSLLVLGLALTWSACGGAGTTPEPPAAKVPVAATKVAALPASGWQQIWNETAAAAQKEGEVVLINRLPSGVRTTLAEAFKKEYGINVEFISETGPELYPKIIAQRAVGLYLPDLIQAGAPSQLDLKKANMLRRVEPELILPEVKDPMAWKDKRLPFQDKEGYVFMFLFRVAPSILANQELVKPDEIKSWRDLLAPKWKGKMVLFDPSIAGPGNGLLTAVDELVGREYLKELARQEPVINRDRRMQVEWVARGKYPLAIGFEFTTMEEMRTAGAPIFHIVPSEGTFTGSGTGSLGIFDRPPHPNAARVFLNWFLSRDTQVLFSREVKEESRRADVPAVLHPDRQVRPEIKYTDFDTDSFQARILQMREQAKEIFGIAAK